MAARRDGRHPRAADGKHCREKRGGGKWRPGRQRNRGGTGLSGRKSWRTEFWVGSPVILAGTLLLGGRLVLAFAEQHAARPDELREIAGFRDVLGAATAVSAERGPANSLLGQEPGADAAGRARLNLLRARNDAALAAMAAWGNDDAGRCRPVEPARAEAVREALVAGRAAVDALAVRPRGLKGIAAVIGEFSRPWTRRGRWWCQRWTA